MKNFYIYEKHSGDLVYVDRSFDLGSSEHCSIKIIDQRIQEYLLTVIFENNRLFLVVRDDAIVRLNGVRLRAGRKILLTHDDKIEFGRKDYQYIIVHREPSYLKSVFGDLKPIPLSLKSTKEFSSTLMPEDVLAIRGRVVTKIREVFLKRRRKESIELEIETRHEEEMFTATFDRLTEELDQLRNQELTKSEFNLREYLKDLAVG